MSSTSAVVCREVFDENSQPSAEEISEYAQQLGIDPESESHLLPLARDGLMQALPPPWKAYFDEKLQTHYYYNEETRKTQWDHPLDNIYRELVKRARDASMQDDTCASVQELLTFEENTKHLERVETKVESDDDDLTTDSENQTDVKDNPSATLAPGVKRLIPLGRPPLAPLARLDKKLSDLRISPLRRSMDNPLSSKPNLVRNTSDRDLLSRPTFERPKQLFKQQSEIIDLKMHILTSPEEENFSPLLSAAKVDKGLPLTGKGSMFLKLSKSDFPSPDTEKSLPLESMTRSDPPKGILREKISDALQRKADSVVIGKSKQAASFEEDRKSVRFKLENLPEPTISPGSNSSSEQNDGQSSIISATPAVLSPVIPSSPLIPVIPPIGVNPSIVLSPLVARPPLPPRPLAGESPREVRSASISEKESVDSDSRESRGTSPRRRVLRPPAGDYIKPDLFQKNFQKISDLVRPGDIEPTSVNLEEPSIEKEARPRSPMIPQKSKISINLMESIESETSIDSPDREFANLDLNDLDDSNDIKKDEPNENIPEKVLEKDSPKDVEITESSEKTTSHSKASSQNKSRLTDSVPIPQIKVPNLDFISKQNKLLHSDSDDSKKSNNEESKTRSVSVEIHKAPQLKVSPTPSFGSDIRSPREFNKPWSPLSTFKPLNKAVIAPQIKTSDSASSLGKSLASPRLDGVILSQGKSTDNVVVVYQFETQEDSPPKMIKSPMIPDMGTRDMIERSKGDERRRLELSLQKELENMRLEWTSRERRMRAELQEELREAEERFLTEKRVRLAEQIERHKREMEEELQTAERNHKQALQNSLKELEEQFHRDTAMAARQYEERMAKLKEEYNAKLLERKQQLEMENERALSDVRDQLQTNLHRERAQMVEENRATIDALREEHTARVTELRHDYRAEVERLRTQHACHLEELRARLASERAASSRHHEERATAEKYKCLKEKYARLKHDVKVRAIHTISISERAASSRHHEESATAEKYKCLKEKYARLKHDVKMSIERRNKRREMSMTTGSETEKSNSHKATQERCKELNEKSSSIAAETDQSVRANNNPSVRYNDNETSQSETHKSCQNNNHNWAAARENAFGAREQKPSVRYNDCEASQSKTHKSCQNNNHNWTARDNTIPSADTSQISAVKHQRAHRRTAVAFREPPRRRRERDRDAVATTDCQDSSDATTADEKPKEALNGHGRRRCFTRLKSASTSRLNYSPKRGEGWSSPLESLRQQLRKLDDLEDQFPDLAMQPAYSLRYPFGEIGTVSTADTPELEFVRHRALVEREGMRRARAVLKRRRAALRETRASLSPHRAPSEEREATELEVALHRARALLGEKEIRLRHIERALRRLADSHPPPLIQEATTSEASSGSEVVVENEAGGAVLRSLRALHADVRDIWRALDARRPHTASPETSSCNAPSTSQTRMTLSAPEPIMQDTSDGGVAERARGLRAWLQTAP